MPVKDNPEAKTCPVCREDFEEFYSEDANPERDDGGLWYFRNAVASDGFNYHRQCLQDKTLNESLEQSVNEEVSKISESTENAESESGRYF